MEKTIIGKIVNTFGLKGELKVLAEDHEYQKMLDLKKFYISGFDDEFYVEKISNQNNKFIKLKIKGFDDINLVTNFKNHNIYILEDIKHELQEGEFLVEDLKGCKLYQNTKLVATLIDVENFGATDIFVLEHNGKEARVPFVKDFIKKIDIDSKQIEVTEHFFEGLVE